ncbi:inhibitor of Bruton tyrosine kinase [Harmonia axyridis]|uniref:inhibitor of Bruton tyrosine kinase n=1 Tax=Harmonia axyridis TaxID=115357 RepID=UPI001E2799BE|nr:inhibitor of Bruton tyrosine kinase [Harmonia axyridis]
MNKTYNFQRDCTEYCRSVIHGNLINSALTVLDVSGLQLCSYLNYICTNCDSVKDCLGRTALHSSASYGNLQVVKWLLKNKNGNINARDNESGYTPLHRALYFGRINIAIELLKAGADPTLLDRDGLTPIEHVIEDGLKPNVTYGTLYTWGLNNNNSLGSFSSRSAPECLEIFHKKYPSEFVQQICIDKFHSIILTKTGKAYSCGHGLGGRLGLGTENTIVNPTLINFPSNVRIEAISIAKDHSLFLSNSYLYSCGLNLYKVLGIVPTPDKTVSPEKVKIPSNINGISAARYHSTAWTSKDLYTWGLNGGQLGHEYNPGNFFIVIPKKASLINVGDSLISKVVSTDGAIAVMTSKGDVYVLHEYQCRKIASRLLDIKDLDIIGGKLSTYSHESLKNESFKELKVVILTKTGHLLLWQESDPHLCKCIFSIPRVLYVTHVSINYNGILFVNNFGESFTGVIKSRKKRIFWDRKQSLLMPIMPITVSKIPRIYRAISIVSDPKGEDFCVIQQNPYGPQIPEQNDLEMDMKKHLTELLEEATEEDNIHDVVIKINHQLYPAHKYILANESNLLSFCDNKNEIILKDINIDLFEELLLYIYTGTCTLLEVGECSKKFMKYCISYSDNEEEINKTQNTSQDPIRILQELSKRFGCKKLQRILSDYYMQNIYIFRKGNEHIESKNYLRKDFPEYYDITIKCSDSKEIKAHKCILVARLEYFSNLFATRWNNDTKSSIIIPYPSNLVEALLEFLYSDSQDFLSMKDGDFLLKLLVLADEYLVDKLKKYCSRLILNINYLDLKNAVEILQLAHHIKSCILIEGVMKYIVNNMAYFLETRAMDDLSDDILTDLSMYYITYRQIDRRYLAYSAASVFAEEIVDIHMKYPVNLEISEKRHIGKTIPKLKRRPKPFKSTVNEDNPKKNSDDEDKPEEIFTEPYCVPDLCYEKMKAEQRVSAICAAIKKLKTATDEPDFINLGSLSLSDTLDNFPLLNSPPENNYHRRSTPLESSSPNQEKFMMKRHRMVRLSQKERMRLSSESKKSAEATTESPKNPWKIISPDVSKNIATSPTDSTFCDILLGERKLKENLVKISNKKLVHTQLEDKAIMDLEKFYNINAVEDEVITVQRVEIGNVASPVWVPGNRVHCSH